MQLIIVSLVAATIAGPALAQSQHTGGLSEEEFKKLHEFKTEPAPQPHGQMIDLGGSQAYLSLPKDGKAPLPALVVVHEWWGLNANIKHWSDRLADDGYAALAVDLYGGKVADNADTAMQLMKAVDEAKSLEIMRKALLLLKTDARIKAEKRGVIGWCFGGHCALRLALAAPDLDAAVIYYGQPVSDVAELKKVHARVLGVFGNRDASIPPARVNEFEKALKEAGVTSEILRYDADHAFANPSNPHYDLKSAGNAWDKARAFLAASLKKPG
ncbi:MAG: dienelactone hydrolase family protein [Planctomycetota bacterium]